MATWRSALVLLATCLIAASASEVDDPFKLENDIIATIAEAGSHGHWRVGKACENCSRGLLATQSLKSGDVIGHLDLDHCIDLDVREHFMSMLVYRVFYEPEINETYGEYLKTLPEPSQVHCYMTMTEQQVDLLQDADYATAISENQEYAETVLNDLVENGAEHGLNWEPSLDQIKYYMGVAVTRSMEFFLDATNAENDMHTFMCPVLDISKHAAPGNADRVQYENSTAALIATADIAEGEEITTLYTIGVPARPDIQLLVYGTLLDENAETPALSAIDLPSFDPEHPFHPSDDSDDLTELSHSDATEELGRVKEILESLPTTEEEDLKILESGEYKGDYYSELIVKWRVLRKRALKQRKEALEKMLSEL